VPEILEVSHRHDAIMNFMLANPTAKLGDVAAEFAVTQPWLSCIIHSHAFKAKLREKQEMMFGDLAATITEKLEAVAHATLDNLLDHALATTAGPMMNLEIADKVLHRLGYAPKTSPVPGAQTFNQTNNFVVNRADLARAREQINGRAQPPQLENPIDVFSAGEHQGAVLEHAPTISTQD